MATDKQADFIQGLMTKCEEIDQEKMEAIFAEHDPERNEIEDIPLPAASKIIDALVKMRDEHKRRSK